MTLLLITACAAIIGGFIVTAHATDTNSTTSSSTTSATSTTSENNATSPQPWGMGDMNAFGQGFGGSMGPRGCSGGFMGGMNNIEVSSDYIANVTAVLDNDTNIQTLLSEGYNVTSINPVIQSVINGDGTITTQATTAIVTLQDGTSDYATAHVDLDSGKVTQIVIITRTVIDNTTTSSATDTTSSTGS